MLSEAESRVGLARRDVHRHIGDVTLFWTGVYPESLPQLQAVEKKDFFVDYCAQGKRAYYIASTIKTDRQEDTPNAIPRAAEPPVRDVRLRPGRSPPRMGTPR